MRPHPCHDVLGWTGWPTAWKLWDAGNPFHKVVYKTEAEPRGFAADFARDYYS